MLRHCTIAELLEVRGGAGSAAARGHAESCDACRMQLDGLHQRAAGLRALPSLSPPRDRWPEVREAYQRVRHRARWRWLSGGAIAAAAVVVLLVGLETGGGGPEARAPASMELQQLVDRSRDLEDALTQVGRDGRVLNGLAATAIADLEDRIALIDVGIAGVQEGVLPAGQLEGLWRRRVALLDALVQTHVQRTAYVGF